MKPVKRSIAVLGKPVVDPAGWEPADLRRDKSWMYRLTGTEIDALVTLARKARSAAGDDPNGLLKLERGDFDLGAFGDTLGDIRKQLKEGLGVALIRGLPLQILDPLEAVTIYWAIGRHLGHARSNNPEGDMIGHVTDLGKTQDDPRSRGYQTREAMDYHCDQSSIVGLLCVRTSMSGGISKLASSVTVYNKLLARSPAAVQLLSEPLCWTKHGEVDPGEEGFYRSPVFSVLDDKLCTSFGPKHIVKGHLVPGAAPLTQAQRDAITLAEDLSEEFHFAMELEQGDMQFLNNFVVLHTRTAYVDWPEPGRKRLLWRLWLDAPDIRPPTQYVKQWESGVRLTSTRPRIAI